MTIEERTARVREVARKLPLVERGRRVGRNAAAPVTARLKARRSPSTPRPSGTP